MPVATLLHNPKAGEESYSHEELIAKIESAGISCIYKSIKDKGWAEIDPRTDFLVVVGGDGTVKKVADKLIDKGLGSRYPIALLPAGTANNIAKTLGLPDDDGLVIDSWMDADRKKFDVGKISNVAGHGFFMESFGFGVFPVLMEEMKKVDKTVEDAPEKRLKLALELLQDSISAYRPCYCKLEIDGTERSGEFLLVEIMNTRSIGPNLVLAPDANPGDGEFEVVLIPERQKDKFIRYVANKIKGLEDRNGFDICKARKIRIQSDGFLAHVDDETVEIRQTHDVQIELMDGILEFLVRRN